MDQLFQQSSRWTAANRLSMDKDCDGNNQIKPELKGDANETRKHRSMKTDQEEFRLRLQLV